MPEDTPDDCPYVVGETYARSDTATFEYKAASPDHTGGGYPRIRSVERGPESGHGSNDVFVPVHRLAAVVWCYPDDWPIEEIVADLREYDVHHELGVPEANGEDWLSLREHGQHSSITQARRRAWAEDDKRQRERDDGGDDCASPGCTEAPAARVAGARYCLPCATDHADGETIEVL